MIGYQLPLPIDAAPPKVRRHGLQKMAAFPYVSPGKQAGRWLGTWRVPAAQAWFYPELGLGRTSNSIPLLLFDVNQDNPTDWLGDVLGDALPTPNWITWRRENRHAHVAYCLHRPVLTGAQTTITPQRWLARIAEYLHRQLKADAAYAAALCHNPMAKASSGRYRTDWMRQASYSLAELTAYLPLGWRMPRPEKCLSIEGRNTGLFRAGMR